MKGSFIARQIDNDLKKEKYYKEKVRRKKCIVDKKKQCDTCNYYEICEEKEER